MLESVCCVVVKKSEYFIRVGELVEEHSRDAALAIVSLPVPRYVCVSTKAYSRFMQVW